MFLRSSRVNLKIIWLSTYIPASSIHSNGTRFMETGCFSIPTVKVLERNPLDIMVEFMERAPR